MFRQISFSLTLWYNFFAIVLTCFLASSTRAQDISAWTPHLAYHTATQTVAVGNNIYARFGENFLSYNVTDTEVRRYTKIEGMSGKALLQIGYSSTTGYVVLAYTNGTLDLFNPSTEQFTPLTYLTENLANTGSPSSLEVSGDFATLTTTNGVAVFNIRRMELRGFFPRPQTPLSAVVNDGFLYVATATGIEAGALTDNLYDATYWRTITSFSTTRLIPFGGRIYLLTANNGLWQLSGTTGTVFSSLQQITPITYTKATINGTSATFSSNTSVAVYTIPNTTSPATVFTRTNTWLDLARTTNGTLFAAEGNNGIVSYRTANTNLVPTGNVIGGYGPIRDLGGYMKFVDNRLLVAGGLFDPYSAVRYPGTAMFYDNGRWTSFDDTYSSYSNFSSIAQDPKDATHHYVTSAEQGLLEYRNGLLVNHYNDQGGILARRDNNVRTNATTYDALGNLWILNMMADSVLCVLSPEGQWSKLYVPGLNTHRFLHSTLFDNKGRLWLASRTWHGNTTGGLFCIDFNGTINDTSDDKVQFRSTMSNTDGTNVNLQSGVLSMAQDLNGQIWLGGQSGVYVIPNPDDFSTVDFRIEQPKVARNDGTNLADYLLSGTYVSAIAVDGANRKWCGTLGGGVYLTNADGTEIIQHFTEENSPLLSNNIYSIATNLETGEVFFGTEAGIISYQSHVTRPYDTLEKQNIKIYPNPASPNHTLVTVSGLTDNASVKIMTTSGFAVASGTSAGGAFLWDLRGPNGKRVASGIYYVLMATSDGNASIVGKVLVI